MDFRTYKPQSAVYLAYTFENENQFYTPPFYVKIGLSSTPMKRLAAINSGVPQQIKRLEVFITCNRHDAETAERKMHRKLDVLCCGGEWFHIQCSTDLGMFQHAVDSILVPMQHRRSK